MRTGDIVLFTGAWHSPLSLVIKLFTWSRWSHVGIIVKHPDSGKLLIFESTSLAKTKDVFRGKISKGVIFTDLEERISRVGGKVYIRHLMNAKFNTIKLREFIRNHYGKPYEKDLIELAGSAVDLPILDKIHNKEGLKSLFCSELVSATYRDQGFINNEPNEDTPADWAKRTDLIKGRLSKLKKIK